MQWKGNCEVISRVDEIKEKCGNDRGGHIAYGKIDWEAWKCITEL